MWRETASVDQDRKDLLCLHAAARPHVGRTSKSLRNKPVDVNLLRNRNQIVRTMLPLPPPLAKT
jgi:hypothetical protein